MFKNFLTDEKIYRACEEYWRKLILDLSRSAHQEGEWEQWNRKFTPDGRSVERDGNPMADGWNKHLGRAFRIIQDREPIDELDISASINKIHAVSNLPREELIIRIGLTTKSLAIAKRLLQMWMMPTTTNQEVRDFIRDRIEPNYKFDG